MVSSSPPSKRRRVSASDGGGDDTTTTSSSYPCYPPLLDDTNSDKENKSFLNGLDLSFDLSPATAPTTVKGGKRRRGGGGQKPRVIEVLSNGELAVDRVSLSPDKTPCKFEITAVDSDMEEGEGRSDAPTAPYKPGGDGGISSTANGKRSTRRGGCGRASELASMRKARLDM